MGIKMKSILLALLTGSFLFGVEITNLSEAVNIAGKQRMFTQRMLKDYAMMGLENNFGNPKEDLGKVMGLFGEHLNALSRFNEDKATAESLKKVDEMWLPIREALQQPPVQEMAAKMQEDV